MTDADEAPLPDDGLGRPRSSPLQRSRLLLGIAAAETLTLVILVINLNVAGRSSALAAALGPIHGALYLAAVLLTWTGAFGRAIKIAAIIPVAGAWIAALAARSRSTQTDGGEART